MNKSFQTSGGTVLSRDTSSETLPRRFRRDPSSLATASLCTSRRAHEWRAALAALPQVCSPPRHFRDTSSGALHQLVRGQGEGLRERADGARRAGVEEVGVGAERAEGAPWEADPAATSAQSRTFCACTLWGGRRGNRWHGAGALAYAGRGPGRACDRRACTTRPQKCCEARTLRSRERLWGIGGTAYDQSAITRRPPFGRFSVIVSQF